MSKAGPKHKQKWASFRSERPRNDTASKGPRSSSRGFVVNRISATDVDASSDSAESYKSAQEELTKSPQKQFVRPPLVPGLSSTTELCSDFTNKANVQAKKRPKKPERPKLIGSEGELLFQKLPEPDEISRKPGKPRRKSVSSASSVSESRRSIQKKEYADGQYRFPVKLKPGDKTIINGRYRVDAVIVEQRDNIIYRGVAVSNGQPIVIKAENKQFHEANYRQKPSFLIEEWNRMNDLAQLIRVLPDGRRVKQWAVPRIYELYEDEENTYLIMQRLGDNIRTLQNSCGGAFDPTTLCKLAYYMLDRIQALHSLGYLHRGVKPDNFCIGYEPRDRGNIYMIDYGEAVKMDLENGAHGIVGNPWFYSLRVENNTSYMHRWDDLEALAYTLLFGYWGGLPWMPGYMENYQQSFTESEKLVMPRMVLKAKALTMLGEYGIEDLLKRFLLYSRRVDDLSSDPDYDHWKGEFRNFVGGRRFKDSFPWQLPSFRHPKDQPQCLSKTRIDPSDIKLLS